MGHILIHRAIFRRKVEVYRLATFPVVVYYWDAMGCWGDHRTVYEIGF